MKDNAVNDLQPIAAAGLDLEEFEGEKKLIEKVEIKQVKSKFSESGEAQTLVVTTEKVAEVTNREGEKVDITASELFNLKEDEKGKLGYSTSPKSKLQKLMKKLGVKQPKELIGKKVVLRIRTKTNDDGTTSDFLGFVTS